MEVLFEVSDRLGQALSKYALTHTSIPRASSPLDVAAFSVRSRFGICNCPTDPNQPDRDIQFFMRPPEGGHIVLGYPLDLNNLTHALRSLPTESLLELADLVLSQAPKIREAIQT